MSQLDIQEAYPTYVLELAEAEAHIERLVAALTRLMAAERAAAKADREALVALRFESPDHAAKLLAQTIAGHELTVAWESARAAIAKAEGRGLTA